MRDAIMSRLLEQALKAVERLPAPEQDAIASIILQEIEAEERWDELFSRPESEDLLSRMADAAMKAVDEGRARKLDLNEL
jgi:hypothetical protein